MELLSFVYWEICFCIIQLECSHVWKNKINIKYWMKWQVNCKKNVNQMKLGTSLAIQRSVQVKNKINFFVRVKVLDVKAIISKYLSRKNDFSQLQIRPLSSDTQTLLKEKWKMISTNCITGQSIADCQPAFTTYFPFLCNLKWEPINL